MMISNSSSHDIYSYVFRDLKRGAEIHFDEGDESGDDNNQ